MNNCKMRMFLCLVMLGLSLMCTLADPDKATLQSIQHEIDAVKKSNKEILEEGSVVSYHESRRAQIRFQSDLCATTPVNDDEVIVVDLLGGSCKRLGRQDIIIWNQIITNVSNFVKSSSRMPLKQLTAILNTMESLLGLIRSAASSIVRKIHDLLQTVSLKASGEPSTRQVFESQSPGARVHNRLKKKPILGTQNDQTEKKKSAPAGPHKIHVDKEKNNPQSKRHQGPKMVEFRVADGHRKTKEQFKKEKSIRTSNNPKSQQSQQSENRILSERPPIPSINKTKENHAEKLDKTPRSPDGDVTGKWAKQSDHRTLVASSRWEVTMYSIRNEKIIRTEKVHVHYFIDSMAYDDQTHHLYWSSVKLRSIGVQIKRAQKILTRFNSIYSNIALDSRERKLFFVTGRGHFRLSFMDLSTNHMSVIQRLPFKHGRMLHLMVDSSDSTIYLLKSVALDAFENMKITYTGRRLTSTVQRLQVANFKSFILAQDLNRFLFCGADHRLMTMSVKNGKRKSIGVCPPEKSAILTYFRGSLCIVGRYGLTYATYDNKTDSLLNVKTFPSHDREIPLAAVLTNMEL